MGADPAFGRRRPCSSECCTPPTRAQDQRHIRREIDAGLDEAERTLLEEALNPGRDEPLTEYQLDLAVRGVPPLPERTTRTWVDMVRTRAEDNRHASREIRLQLDIHACPLCGWEDIHPWELIGWTCVWCRHVWSD